MWDNIRPVIKIYLHNDKSNSLVSIIDDKKTSKDPKNYSWTIDDPKIMRGQFYDAEVSWVEKRDEYETVPPATPDDAPTLRKTGKTYDKVLCSKRFTFSTELPTVVIDGEPTITMQKRFYSEKNIVKSGNNWIHDLYFNYGFRTNQRFTGRDNIAKWGFMVGEKNYEVDTTPPSDNVAVVWKMKKQKSKREFLIAPYVIPKNAGGSMVYGPTKTITLEYDAKFNEYNDVWENIDGHGYYTSGFDKSKSLEKETDYVMDDYIKSRQSDCNEDDDDSTDNHSQVIVFEIDE